MSAACAAHAGSASDNKPSDGGVQVDGEQPSVARKPGTAARWLRGAVSAPIVVYSRFISPGLPRRCKYEPTCSRYAIDAIGEYGILRGLVLGVWRLLRCNPWSYGGYDPVEAQRVFRVRRGGG